MEAMDPASPPKITWMKHVGNVTRNSTETGEQISKPVFDTLQSCSIDGVCEMKNSAENKTQRYAVYDGTVSSYFAS